MILTILFTEYILFNPVALGLILLVLTIVGFVLFVECYPLSDSCWKKIEIIFLIFNACGIVGLVKDNRRFFYEREQKTIGYRIDTYRHQFNFVLDTAMYNRFFSTTLYSPENLREVEKEYKTMYLWALNNRSQFIQKVCKRESIDCDSIVFPLVADDFLLQDIEICKNLISEYNELVDKYQHYACYKDENGLEFYYNRLYPLCFVFGLSYSFVRYLGECRNRKKRKK